MKVLVACEFSGTVRDAFLNKGHDAYSCDIKPAKSDRHLQCDVFDALDFLDWDLVIAHPPCTHLAVCGAKHFDKKKDVQEEALDFVLRMMNSDAHSIAVENPVSIISSRIRKPDQIIQPWMFGDSFQKSTCLWLKNLPKLRATDVVDKGEMVTLSSGKRLPKWYSNAPTKDRAAIRSVTFQGIADAMADQWGRQHTTGFGLDRKFKKKERT